MVQSGDIHVRMIIAPAPWTRALEDGSVQVPGLSWECISNIDNAPDRFIATEGGGVDVGENGVRRLLIDLEKGARPSAIPVFFGRELMQRNFIVRSDSPLRSLSDLAGKRIGSRLSTQSGTGAAVLMVMKQAFGVDLHSIEWICGNPSTLPANRMGLKMRQGPTTDEEAFDGLMRGDFDALMETT